MDRPARCACADGIRASCAVAGCSAGRCASCDVLPEVEAGSGPRGLAPSTTAVDDAGSRQGQQAPAYATASSLNTARRPLHRGPYGALERHAEPPKLVRPVVHNGLCDRSDPISVGPASVSPRHGEHQAAGGAFTDYPMSYPHCGELCPPRAKGTADVLIDLGDLWTRAKQSVPETQRAWVDLTEPVALTHDSLVLVTGSEFTKDMLETKLRPPSSKPWPTSSATRSRSRSSSTSRVRRRSPTTSPTIWPTRRTANADRAGTRGRQPR